MKVFHLESFFPKFDCLVILTSTQGHDGLLIVDICPLANERLLHLVEWPLKELLVLFDEESLDILELAFPLAYRIDIDALN